jgi:Flp pilus assembly protein TadG
MDKRSTFERMLDRTMRPAFRRRCLRSEEGSAILETAMSTIIMLVFIFGVMETGFALYSYHFISEAAREGTRYAIVRGSTAGSACASYDSSACKASSTDVANYVKNLGFPGIKPSDITVNPVWSVFTGGSTCPGTPPCNSPGNQIAVTVQYNFHLNVPFIPPHTYAMSSTAAMVIQQ